MAQTVVSTSSPLAVKHYNAGVKKRKKKLEDFERSVKVKNASKR